MPSFGYPRGVSQSARICPETRQREERGQIGRRKRRRITCSCWGQGHASTMIRGVIPQEVELTGEIGGWKPRPRGLPLECVEVVPTRIWKTHRP